MANHKSAEKRNRQRITRTDRNRAAKSAVRSIVKKARTAITHATATAAPVVKEAVSALDRAASKGSIHPKAASRRKARLARALHKAATAAAAAPKALESSAGLALAPRWPEAGLRVRCLR